MQVLVIARIKAGTPVEKVKSLVQAEAAHVWECYAAEKIRQSYYIADMSGAVMIWEVESIESITQEVNQLPMVQEGILVCEILPIKHYTGYASLFAQA
jgi:Muconolactone delta-isomerase